eukprot:CAMPEP_0173109292 /NCGR_PEP_ID=MMETSP1102-20130122/43347_1 /TAXON_ID=49646 /ORGANISM="Geminigera sp., Strain Caron Lab Isolate" /LENGTH=94 /DNA_ID=CAMNT_0014008167 /DNA_START=73 /DNA_END=354 /DNA_ORIENTATION=+
MIDEETSFDARPHRVSFTAGMEGVGGFEEQQGVVDLLQIPFQPLDSNIYTPIQTPSRHSITPGTPSLHGGVLRGRRTQTSSHKSTRLPVLHTMA